ncbi:MAG: hypothetical protein VXZ96_01010 [Myxococcota bacterium]|nr:hypothetical protein [Myxococcota bacterium]
MILLLSLLSQYSHGAEAKWNGFYRARAQRFNSLSLSDTNPYSEGAASTITHRFRLEPTWYANSKVAIHAQLDMLPYTLWGDQPVLFDDPSYDELDVFFSQSLQPPTSDDGSMGATNIQATRVWGEVITPIGSVQFGRMPVHWGSGLVFNAGNNPLDEFGDTADRVQFTAKAEQVFVMTALESNNERFVNEQDDAWSAAAAVMYNTERASTGLYTNYHRQNVEDLKFGLFTIDLYGGAEAGALKIDLEMAANFGSGDLPNGLDGVRISSFGAALDAAFNPSKLLIGLGAGFATGDKDPTDKTFHTFRFDPDYHIGLMLFEEPMPTLQPLVSNVDNDGRDTSIARTGYSVSNILYGKPRLGYYIKPGLLADLSILAARAPNLPEDESDNNGYGMELDAHIGWNPVDHFQLDATGAVFFPGTYYRNFSDADLGGGFNSPAIGMQLLSSIEF